jgi:uncharacterized protein (TIGR02246 family)
MSAASFLRRAALITAMTATTAAADPAAWTAQVTAAENAFARSMAERDHVAFSALLSEQAVFFGGQGQVHRGKAAVAEAWRRFFDGPQAPFTWSPDRVEVLADGTLALSTGPVRDPQGQVIARFNSIWRQEAPGVWRVIFDKGQPPD